MVVASVHMSMGKGNAASGNDISAVQDFAFCSGMTGGVLLVKSLILSFNM
jgi:hypothetical protein